MLRVTILSLFPDYFASFLRWLSITEQLTIDEQHVICAYVTGATQSKSEVKKAEKLLRTNAIAVMISAALASYSAKVDPQKRDWLKKNGFHAKFQYYCDSIETMKHANVGVPVWTQTSNLLEGGRFF